MALVGLLGVSGLAGGAQFVIAPSGRLVGLATTELSGSPFGDFLVPGLILFTVLGVFPLVTLYGLLRGRRWAWPATLVVGVAFAVWVIVEGLVIGFGERLQYPHLAQAVVIVALALTPSVRAQYRA
ncbi:MAG: hypothetical protein ABEJ08_05225 [Halobacteriaceae archaeon]